jgi:NAD(P)-dependent dehydrogenase (short-subunit alcohol dehydrogenase family)
MDSAGNIKKRLCSLEGQVALVTGGHRGIGGAISVALATLGADIIVVDRSGPQESDVPERALAIGRQVLSVKADLADEVSVRDAIMRAQHCSMSIFGKDISILVNNAGIADLASLENLSMTTWDEVMNINVRSALLIAQLLCNPSNAGKSRGMLDRPGGGTIVNVSSAASTAALVDHGAYCASKAALNMVTRSMAKEWAGRGVRVNGVAPTVVLTEMGKKVWSAPDKRDPMLARIPAGRFAKVEEISDVVAFLCSDASAMIHGQTIAVDGGYSA